MLSKQCQPSLIHLMIKRNCHFMTLLRILKLCLRQNLVQQVLTSPESSLLLLPLLNQHSVEKRMKPQSLAPLAFPLFFIPQCIQSSDLALFVLMLFQQYLSVQIQSDMC